MLFNFFTLFFFSSSFLHSHHLIFQCLYFFLFLCFILCILLLIHPHHPSSPFLQMLKCQEFEKSKMVPGSISHGSLKMSPSNQDTIAYRHVPGWHQSKEWRIRHATSGTYSNSKRSLRWSLGQVRWVMSEGGCGKEVDAKKTKVVTDKKRKYKSWKKC